MQPWSRRAVEEANLFNPAFGATLIAKGVGEFGKKASGRPMAFALAFLVLPIILHRATREALPNSTVTSLLSWLQENREQLVEFSSRVRRLKPITQESLMFGIAHRAIEVSDGGGLVSGARRILSTKKGAEFFTPEVEGCMDRAAFVGRWFATAGTPATILAAWGVIP